MRSNIKSDVELALSICGALDNGIGLGGGLELTADTEGEGQAGADVYGSGGGASGGAELGVTIIGLEMGAGAGLSAEGCLETSFPIPPPGDASITAITNPGSGIDPQVLAEQISAASTQTGVSAKLLNAASAIPLPGNLGDIIADPVAHIPADLNAATPSCESDYSSLSALIDSICIEAAAAPDLGQIIQDINGIVEELQAQVSALDDRVSNVQQVLGTERPVDGTGNNNGAQPISYWSYNSWARDIQHSTALNSLDGKVSANLDNGNRTTILNIESIAGDAHSEVADARFHTDRAATLSGRICEAFFGSQTRSLRVRAFNNWHTTTRNRYVRAVRTSK